jgi:hypothetical protein
MDSLGTFTVKAIYSAGMIDRINGLDSVGPKRNREMLCSSHALPQATKALDPVQAHLSCT